MAVTALGGMVVSHSVRTGGYDLDEAIVKLLADSQRLEPGRGHLDLAPAFAALARLSYRGYASFELAALSGDAAAVLPASVAYVRTKLAEAGLA